MTSQPTAKPQERASMLDIKLDNDRQSNDTIGAKLRVVRCPDKDGDFYVETSYDDHRGKRVMYRYTVVNVPEAAMRDLAVNILDALGYDAVKRGA